MPDLQSAFTKSVDALNEVAQLANQPTYTDLQNQLTSMTQDRDHWKKRYTDLDTGMDTLQSQVGGE